MKQTPGLSGYSKQTIKDLQGISTLGDGPWGAAPGMSALQDTMDLNRMHDRSNRVAAATPKWFTMKMKSHRWWHWITNPRRTWVARKWLKEVEKQIHEEIDLDGYNKAFMDSCMFATGTYPRQKFKGSPGMETVESIIEKYGEKE